MTHGYLPILYGKRAEFNALARLSATEQVSTLPLIDFLEPTPPKRRTESWTQLGALEERLIDPDDGLIGCWGANPVLLDFGRLDNVRSQRRQAIEQLCGLCHDIGLSAIPVTSPSRSRAYRAAAAQAVRHLGLGGALRLAGDDKEVGRGGLEKLLAQLDLPLSRIDLIIDVGQIDPSKMFIQTRTAIECLTEFGSLGDWRSISLAGTSFPANLGQVVEYNSHRSLPRVEVDIWRRVVRDQTALEGVIFGDYGIVTADIQAAFRGAANLRYADCTSWLVLRGFPPDKAPADDYRRLARELVQMEGSWRGLDHCPGCRFIFDRASGGAPGNSTQWRSAGFSHHFAVVLAQVSAHAR